MNVSARPASAEDLDDLTALYRDLATEQAELRPLWPLADGLDEPVEVSFRSVLDDPRTVLLIGTINDVPVGLLWARPEPLLAQAAGEEVATIRLIYTQPEARGVGVGEAMMAAAMATLRSAGFRYFDARVSPGHRLAKNFFESNGFKARLILMHRDDDADR